MNLVGLPDFSRPLAFVRGQGYHMFRHQGVTVLPYSAELPIADNGLPTLGLQLLRPAFPTGDNDGYAILSAILRPMFDLASARNYLLERGNPEPVHNCDLQQGHAMFRSPELFADTDFQEQLEVSSRMGFEGTTVQRLVMRLSVEAGFFWRDLILSGTLLVSARLAYQIKGVAARVNQIIEFKSKALLQFLHSALDLSEGVSRAELLTALDTDFDSIPMTMRSVDGGSARALVIDTLADHLLDEFALSSHVDSSHSLRYQLSSPDQQPDAEIIRDLSLPLLTERLWEVSASPFETLDDTFNEQQLARLVTQRSLNFLDRRRAMLHVYSNFFENTQALLALGAHIRQPATPPERPFDVIKSLDVLADGGESSVLLFTTQDSSMSYEYEGFAVLQTDLGIIDARGDAKTVDDRLLVLAPNDYAVEILAFSLASAWHDSISAVIECGFSYQQQRHLSTARLGQSDWSAQILVPQQASELSIEVTLTELASGNTLTTEYAVKLDTRIEPLAYARCGPQQISVSGEFDSGQQVLAVELLPLEDDPDDSAAQLVHLTAEKPVKTWQWFVHSPFKSGYQFRILDSIGEPAHDWLAAPYPFQDLVLSGNTDQPVTQTNHSRSS